MSYPKGTRFHNWSTCAESPGKPKSIKRWVVYPDGAKKCERLPVRQYAHLRDRPDELAAYLVRLNAENVKERRIRDGVEVRHAYLNEELLDRYAAMRRQAVPNQERVTAEMYRLRKHVIGFFVNRLDLPSPLEWHRVHKSKWAEYLTSDEVPASLASKREVIQACNRFMAWLREERPGEVPEKPFEPLSADRFKAIRARREIDPAVRKRTFIRADHWEAIKRSLPPEIEPFVKLGYHYGVRRSEALGALPGDVKKGCLSVERQLERVTPTASYMPTKGRLKRSVPHWNATAAEAYGWVEAVQKHRIDPDHLTDLWNDLMAALGYRYTFHELRHSFVTNALAKHVPRAVQMAAGHQHVQTTMGYAHDDRDLDDEEFKPVAS